MNTAAVMVLILKLSNYLNLYSTLVRAIFPVALFVKVEEETCNNM